jgi:hypothetical protein
MRMKAPLVSAALFLFALALIPSGLQAQNLAEGWLLTPKSGSEAGFVEAFKSHMAFRQAQGEPWSWQMWEVIVGENVGDFMVISMGHDWADFDAYENSEFLPAASAHFGATVGPLVEDAQNMILQADTTFQHMPTDPSYEVGFIQMVTFHLIPGKAMVFHEAMAKLQEAMVDGGMPGYWVGTAPVIGGPGDSYSVAILGRTWADFSEPDPTMEEMLIDSYGAEEAMAVFTSIMESYHKSESVMLRFRPDLSILPEM